jgi:hypothetical protein
MDTGCRFERICFGVVAPLMVRARHVIEYEFEKGSGPSDLFPQVRKVGEYIEILEPGGSRVVQTADVQFVHE